VSVDPFESRRGGSKGIVDTQGRGLNYPLVGEEDRTVANLYGRIHPTAIETTTVRTVLVLGPDKLVKLSLTYPANVGRNVDEIVRALDVLQLSSRYVVSTPVNWTDDDEMIFSPAVADDEAKERFPKGFKTLKPCLRLAPQPNK
jgi:thioredoxin-dependent peroxiredoxin